MRRDMIFLALAAAALIVVICTRKHHGGYAQISHAGIADNEEMIADAQSIIVGDSAPGEINPRARVALANIPWRRAMGYFVPLRSTVILNRQRTISGVVQQNNSGE